MSNPAEQAETEPDQASEPAPDENPAGQLLPLIGGKWITYALYGVAELGVPDALADGPRTASQLAQATGTDEEALFRVLRTLASVGVFEQDGRRFALTPVGALLREDVPGSMRNLVLIQGRGWHSQTWDEIVHTLRTGQPAVEHVHGQILDRFLEDRPGDQQTFQEALTKFTGSLAPLFTQAIEPARFQRIVDVGGGHGVLLAALLEAAPEARGVLFDLPSVVEGAGPVLAERGVADRVEATGGDFLETVPEGGDAYVLTNIVHNWDDDRAATLLSNIREAADPGARVFVIDQIIPTDGTPHFGKLLDLELLVFEHGGPRTEAGYRALLEEAGFEVEGITRTPAPLDVIEARSPQ